MERTWYWRLGLVLAVLFWSIWQLVPTWAYFRLPPEERNGPAYEQSVPGWAPDAKKHLNLGLDLQGGILLAMGVDVDRAVKAKVVRRADEVADFLKGKNVPVTSAGPSADGYRVEVRTTDPKQAEQVVLDFYGVEMSSPGRRPGGNGVVRVPAGGHQELQGEGRRAGGEDHPQPRRQVGRLRARHQAQAERADPDRAARASRTRARPRISSAAPRSSSSRSPTTSRRCSTPSAPSCRPARRGRTAASRSRSRRPAATSSSRWTCPRGSGARRPTSPPASAPSSTPSSRSRSSPASPATRRLASAR